MVGQDLYCKASLTSGISLIIEGKRLMFSLSEEKMLSNWNKNSFEMLKTGKKNQINNKSIKNSLVFKQIPYLVKYTQNNSQFQQSLYQPTCRSCQSKINKVWNIVNSRDIHSISNLKNEDEKSVAEAMFIKCLKFLKYYFNDRLKEDEKSNQQKVIQKLETVQLYVFCCQSCHNFSLLPLEVTSSQTSPFNHSSSIIFNKLLQILLSSSSIRSNLNPEFQKCIIQSRNYQLSYLSKIDKQIKNLWSKQIECQNQKFYQKDVPLRKTMENYQNTNYRYHKAYLSVSCQEQFHEKNKKNKIKSEKKQNYLDLKEKQKSKKNMSNFSIDLSQKNQAKNSYYRLKNGRRLVSDRSNLMNNVLKVHQGGQNHKKSKTLRNFNQTLIEEVTTFSDLNPNIIIEQSIIKQCKDQSKVKECMQKRDNFMKRVNTQQNRNSNSTKKRRSSDLLRPQSIRAKAKKQNKKLLNKEKQKSRNRDELLIQRLKLVRSQTNYRKNQQTQQRYLQTEKYDNYKICSYVCHSQLRNQESQNNANQQSREERSRSKYQSLNSYVLQISQIEQIDCVSSVQPQQMIKCKQKISKEIEECDIKIQQVRQKRKFDQDSPQIKDDVLLRQKQISQCKIQSQLISSQPIELSNKNIVKQGEKYSQSNAFQLWQAIQAKLLSIINPVGQSVNFLLQKCKKNKINAIKQLYLLYKKFFYMRTTLSSSLIDCQFPIFPHINQVEWSKVISDTYFKQKIQQLEMQNTQVLKNVQKMCKKVQQKHKFEKNGILQIIIHDEGIYSCFIRQMILSNIKIIRRIISLNRKENEQVILFYLKNLVLAATDEFLAEQNKFINQQFCLSFETIQQVPAALIKLQNFTEKYFRIE